MSREIRRVPLDFDFPLGKTWDGYLMPDDVRLPLCELCEGQGDTPAARWLQSIAYLFGNLADDVRDQEQGRPLHPYLDKLENRPYHFAGKRPYERAIQPRPSADILELVKGLVGEESDPVFGFRFSNTSYAIIKTLMAAAGVSEEWGVCSRCKGEGVDPTPAQQVAYDAWTETKPPTGPGFQLWQTVSEGGPVSPVFANPVDLADWIIDFGREFDGKMTPRASLIAWIEREGTSLGSFVMVGTEITNGVEAAAHGIRGE